MSLVERLVPDVLQMLGAVTGLVTVAMVLALLCASRGPAVRHGILLSALIATLLSPLVVVGARCAGFRLATIPLVWRAYEREPENSGCGPVDLSPDSVMLHSLMTLADDPARTLAKATPADSASATPAHSALLDDQTRHHAGSAGSGQKNGIDQALRFSVFIWALGALVLLARMLRGLFVLQLLRRSARPPEQLALREALEEARAALGVDTLPAVLVSPRLAGPVALGVIRPVVLLPAGLIESLPRSALRDVIVHESAHLLRRDPLIGLLQRLAELLYWPQPLVHLLNRRLSRAREEVCDNHVLAGRDPCDYARTLLLLAERGNAVMRPLGSLALLHARWKLEDRVAGLLDPRRTIMTRINRGSLALAASLLVATGLTFAGIRFEKPVQGAGLEPPAAIAQETSTTSGPTRAEIADLIRAIGRDTVSQELVDRVAAWYHPRFLWSHDFARMKQVATDPQVVQRLDALAKEVQGKPLDTVILLNATMSYMPGYDDAMMKRFIRGWIADENGPLLTIRGTVVDDDTKQPIPFPRVFGHESIASSDKDGRFQLTVRRKPGAKGVSLWVEAQGHASAEILVRSEDQLRIAVRQDVPFFGRVVDQDGKPVAGAEVSASVQRALMVLGDTKVEEFRGGSNGIFQVRTDQQGRFSFQGVPDSSSPMARARMMEAEFLGRVALNHKFADPRWPFQIIAREVQGKSLIDVKFRQRSRGKGNAEAFSDTVHAVRAELRFDLVKKLIRVRLEDAVAQGKDRNGDDEARMSTVSLDIPFPKDLWPRPSMQPIYLEVTHPGFRPSHTEASAPTSADAAPLIRLQPGLAVSGRVVDTQGKPIGNAWIQVRETETGGYPATAYADRVTGTFTTPASLKPGEYAIVVQSAKHAASWRMIVVEKALPAQQFVLEPGGYISGKVVTASGKPVAGAAVGWVQPAPTDHVPRSLFTLQNVVATDADGKFRLGPLPEGEFQITALADAPRRLANVTARTNTARIIKLPSE